MANKIAIFIIGAVILSLQILGSRILAPHLGTTITVWAAIIGIILASVSIGYYLGGILADKKLSKNLLSLILFLAGIFVILIIPIKNNVLGFHINYSYGVRSVFSSIAIFLIPGILLGAGIIYTIKLETKNIKTIGSANGTLYGISTAGSIIGVFLTSFYLIPNFTATNIISGLGIILFLTSFLILYSKSPT